MNSLNCTGYRTKSIFYTDSAFYKVCTSVEIRDLKDQNVLYNKVLSKKGSETS